MAEEKILLVDLGSVVIKFDWGLLGKTLLEFYRGGRGLLIPLKDGPLTPEQFIKPLRRSHRYIDEFDLGHITPFEFYCLATDLLKLERRDISYKLFRQIYGEESISLNEPMVELLKRQTNVRKIIASNINDISWIGLQKKYGQQLMNLFDDEVLSYVIRHRKPEADFFLECARRSGERLETLYFVDDREVNVSAFRDLGGKAVQYDLNDHRNGEEKLMSMLYPHR